MQFSKKKIKANCGFNFINVQTHELLKGSKISTPVTSEETLTVTGIQEPEGARQAKRPQEA